MRRCESERDPGSRTRHYTRIIRGWIYVNVSITHMQSIGGSLPSRRESDCINAKRAGRKISTHGWPSVVNESLFIGIGTQVSATRPRTCVREGTRAYVPERLADGRKVNVFSNTHVRRVRRFSRLAAWKIHELLLIEEHISSLRFISDDISDSRLTCR